MNYLLLKKVKDNFYDIETISEAYAYALNETGHKWKNVAIIIIHGHNCVSLIRCKLQLSSVILNLVSIVVTLPEASSVSFPAS